MDNIFPIEDIFDVPGIFSAEEYETGIHRDAAAALANCINTIGRVDLQWMAQYSGIPTQELIPALKGIIFQDPAEYDLNHAELDGWFIRSQYISGNVKQKLEIAEEMDFKYHGRFSENVQALQASMPERVSFQDIGICIGSPWIPAEYYAQFAREVLMVPGVSYSSALHQWKVQEPPRVFSVRNNYTYGTERVSAAKNLEYSLHMIPPKVYDEEVRPDRKNGTARILNVNETLAAQEKQEVLQKAFLEWVVKDPQRVQYLTERYYRTYVCNVAGRYDGSFLTLPDLNPDFVPHIQQKNAVAHIILDPRVFVFHQVGSGKTNILIMGIHERYRMGISKKNLVVVPNNVLEAFERAHRYLYPEDNILVVRPNREFSTANRRKTLEKIRDEDYTAVYMAFSSFDMIRMSRQYTLDKKADEIRALRGKLAASTDAWEKRALDNLINRMCLQYAKMETELPEDPWLSFDQLGITTLVVDEIHYYKNISLKTRVDGVVGMHAKGSSKCDLMLEKVHYMHRNCNGVIFSTGTPMTNSIADLFVMQTYLQPEELEMLHLGHFDEWISCFASRQSHLEIDVDAQNFRIMTRFSRFHNLPELITLFANVCDTYVGLEHDTYGLPACDNYIDIEVPKGEEQSEYIEELVYRTELIRAKLVKPDEDNLLKITHDGHAVSLDIREVDPTKTPDPKGTKAYACALNVHHCWQNYPGTAQLVFCDFSTPKQGFNVYDTLKNHLIEMGIPEEQIAFIHDAKTDQQRRKLFEKVNKAEIRILVGSTSKLGVGVNVQERLIALHHLDVPWRPSDIIQREGRMIRQGNTNANVFRYRYITAGTFDAYFWQILENKQRFIGQFMLASASSRESRDIDDTVLSYAEIKALCVGDPLLKTRIETNNRLDRVKILSRQREMELQAMQSIINEAPNRRKDLKQRRQRLLDDMAHFSGHQERLSKVERLAFGEDLLEALAGNQNLPTERCFDTIHGFDIRLPAYMNPEKPRIFVVGQNRYEVDMRDAKPYGCLQRIEHLLGNLSERVQRVADEMKNERRRVAQAREEIAAGNPHTQEIARLREQLLDIDKELNRRAEECAI